MKPTSFPKIKMGLRVVLKMVDILVPNVLHNSVYENAIIIFFLPVITWI